MNPKYSLLLKIPEASLIIIKRDITLSSESISNFNGLKINKIFIIMITIKIKLFNKNSIKKNMTKKIKGKIESKKNKLIIKTVKVKNL